MLDLVSFVAEEDYGHGRRVYLGDCVRGGNVHGLEQLPNNMGLSRENHRARRDTARRTNLNLKTRRERSDGAHGRTGSHRGAQVARERAWQRAYSIQPRKKAAPWHPRATAAAVKERAGYGPVFALHLHQAREYGRYGQLIGLGGI